MQPARLHRILQYKSNEKYTDIYLFLKQYNYVKLKNTMISNEYFHTTTNELDVPAVDLDNTNRRAA